MRLRQRPRRPVLRIVRRVPRVGGQAGRRDAGAGAGTGDSGGATTPGDPAHAAAAGASGAAAWGAPYGDPLPTPVRPAAPEPETYDEDGDGIPDGPLVRCPACGIANPSNRTFCQSCGTTLAAAERVVEPPPEQVAEAVAWTPTPPPSPVIGATKPRARVPPGARGDPGLGRSAWPWSACSSASRSCSRASPCAAARPKPRPQPSGAAPSGAAVERRSRGQRVGGRARRPVPRRTLTLTRRDSVLGRRRPAQVPAARKAIDGDPRRAGRRARRREEPVDRGGLRSRARRHAGRPQRQPGLGGRVQGLSPAQGRPGHRRQREGDRRSASRTR